MCGILAIYSKSPQTVPQTVGKTIQQLQRLQHRGKDSWGISCFSENGDSFAIKMNGMINMNDMCASIREKRIHHSIGHVRYATSGKNETKEIQPLIHEITNLSLVHNGNIPIFEGHDTSELFKMIIHRRTSNIEDTLIYIMNTIVGSYSLIIMVGDTLYVMKDRYGIRPLCIGENEHHILISSESCAIRDYVTQTREIHSGQILKIDSTGIQSLYLHPKHKDGICIFELIYFMNKDSYYHQKKIEDIRFELGQLLARKETLQAKDFIVTGIPSSGVSAAKSYAKCMGFEYIQAIKKVGKYHTKSDRTFIIKDPHKRTKACSQKFKFDAEKLRNRKVIVIDDTIVRGNVIKTIIAELKSIGTSEIHVRIPSAPVIDICQLGIAIHTKEELLMNNRSISDVKSILGVDSIRYLTYSEFNNFSPNSYKQCFGQKIDPSILRIH